MNLQRASGLLLIIYFLIYVFTGYTIIYPEQFYGLTFGILNRGFAFDLHAKLVLPIVFLFLVHALIGLRWFRLSSFRLNLGKEVTREDLELGIFLLIVYAVTIWTYYR